MSQQEKHCFVISPIGEAGSSERLRSDQVFRHIIKPIAELMGYKVDRADLLTSPGIITHQIIDKILSCDLIIADLTDHNPNVFYELALSHAFGKPVIPIIKEGQKIPFDNNQVRTIFYNHNDLDNVADCKKQIKEYIISVEKDPKTYNPITTTVELEKLKESSNPEVRQTGEILDLLISLAWDVKSLKEPIIKSTRFQDFSKHRSFPDVTRALGKIRKASTALLIYSEELAEASGEGAAAQVHALSKLIDEEVHKVIFTLDDIATSIDQKTYEEIQKALFS